MTDGLVWSFVLSALGIVGIILAGSKRKVGWLIGFFVQPLWIVFALTTGQYGFILNAVIYATVYARNWLRWHKEQAQERDVVAPLPGRTLYTGDVMAGDWHSAPPFIALSDGRWYHRRPDEY